MAVCSGSNKFSFIKESGSISHSYLVCLYAFVFLISQLTQRIFLHILDIFGFQVNTWQVAKVDFNDLYGFVRIWITLCGHTNVKYSAQ